MNRKSQEEAKQRDPKSTIASPDQGPPERPDTQAIAKNFGHFQLQEKLGSGAFGTVFRAYDTRLRREVAIKVPTKRVLNSPQLRERFQREARAAASVQHPNICPIYEVGEHQSIPF